jgi:hypothetical protein
MKEVFNLLRKVAESQTTVLVYPAKAVPVKSWQPGRSMKEVPVETSRLWRSIVVLFLKT